MGISKEQSAANRERILEVASKEFRERGFDGIAIAELMKEAGLTHGGFYAHFESKEDLATHAIRRATKQALEGWHTLADKYGDKVLGQILEEMKVERDEPGMGCMFAALGPEIARQEKPVRQAATEGMKAIFDLLLSMVPGRSEGARRRAAISTYASLIGGLILARVAADDPALSDEILEAVVSS
jgi:TetR/AcrR family transcriptional repressor of nem operon